MFVFIFVRTSFSTNLYIKNHFENEQMLVYILENCIFANLHGKDTNGGAICLISNQELSIDVKDTFVFNCSVLSGFNGGGIYFCSPKRGNATFQRVCGAGCIAYGYTSGPNGQGQFLFAQVNNNCHIGLHYVTIVKCSPELSAKRWRTSSLLYGYQLISNTNVSKNYVEWYSSFVIDNGKKVEICFFSVLNNTAMTYSIFSLYQVPNCIISKMNFLYNAQNTNSNGLFLNQCDFCRIKDSVFQSNNIGGSSLFCGFGGSIVIDSCYIDTYSFKSTSPSLLSLISAIPTYSIIHYHSFLCLADNPFLLYPTFNYHIINLPFLFQLCALVL